MVIRTTFADIAANRDNNFNLIRMVAAVAVLVSHSFNVTAGAHAEPIVDGRTLSLGSAAVLVFFALSGFFITKSMAERRSLVQFATARVLRLVPGLAVALIISAFVVGPLFTSLTLPDYLSRAATYLYVLYNASFIGVRFDLPGVFMQNPYPAVVNGSLWSLPYEVRCYLVVTFLGLVGMLRPKLFAIPLVVILVLTAGPYWTANDAVAPRFAGLAVPYALGAAAYVYRRFVPLNGWIALALAVLTIVLSPTRAFREVFVIAMSYGAFWLGSLRTPLLAYNRIGDLSYGTYVYAFVVQQSLVARFPQMGPWGLMAAALPITLILAWVSWILVERPALDSRKAVGERIEALIARLFPQRKAA